MPGTHTPSLTDCAQACTADADDDLSEPDLTSMVKCIRLCLDCADICTTTASVTSRHMHAHCRVCAEACRRCEAACRDLLTATA